MEPLPGAPTTLRPLGLGELLDRAVTLCVRNFWLLAAIYVGYAILGELISFVSGNQRDAFFSALTQMLKNGSTNAAALQSLPQVPLPWLGALLLQGLLLYPLVFAALAWAASDVYLGRRTTVGQSYAVAARRWPQLLLLNFTYFLAAIFAYVALTFAAILVALVVALVANSGARMVGVAIGVVLALVAGIALVGVLLVVLLAYFLSFFACVIEGVNFAEGFVSGFRRVFARVGLRRSLLVGLAYWAIMIGVDIVALVSEGAVVNLAHSALLSSLVSIVTVVAAEAFGAVFIVLFYYDLRVREEGLDLQIAAATLSTAAPPAV